MKTSDPNIKLNGQAEKRFVLTVAIQRAPGPFDAVKGFAYYQVVNPECVPVTPLSGVRLEPRKTVEFTLPPRQIGSYEGVFYLDQMLNEDYFGLGVCRWGLVAIGVNLTSRNVVFNQSLFLKDIVTKNAVTTLFANKTYKEYSGTSAVNGELAPGNDYMVKNPGEFFSVTLDAKEGVK